MTTPMMMMMMMMMTTTTSAKKKNKRPPSQRYYFDYYSPMVPRLLGSLDQKRQWQANVNVADVDDGMELEVNIGILGRRLCRCLCLVRLLFLPVVLARSP
jgi:hypothetical protein